MAAQPYRSIASVPTDPCLHELPPLHLADQMIVLQLSVRRDADGVWRAWLRFVDQDGRVRDTAEIFRGASETELWQSVNGLQEHHLRALYLSLA